MLSELDRRIINELQRGFPVSEHPYADVAARLGTTEAELLERLRQMLDEGVLMRFGPLYHAEKMGGGLTLAAMSVPAGDFEAVTEIVNSFPEVSHNYAREHRLNMWFVVGTERPERIGEVISEIEQRTGYKVYNMPKKEEFFVGLHFGV